MLAEARRFERSSAGRGAWRIGVSSGRRPLPAWKKEADFLLAQVCFSLPELLGWRERVEFTGPVYAGVLVVASAPMARKLSADIPELSVPDEVIAAVERDTRAGVALACDLVVQIRDSGAFEGVHLVPVSRTREVAAHLEDLHGC